MKRTSFRAASLLVAASTSMFGSAGCRPAVQPSSPPQESGQLSEELQLPNQNGPTSIRIPRAQGTTDADDNVVQLDLRNCELNDEDLKSLENLKFLKVLKLSGKDGACTVTDAGLASIGKLTQLKVLALDFLPITQAGLQQLANLSQLQELYLANTGINDAATVELQNFPHLKKLRLAGTTVSAESASRLVYLAELGDLDVSECEWIDDVAAEQFAKLPRLEKLNLYRTIVGNPGAIALAECPSLTWLNLDATPVSDAGLAGVSKLTDLKFLHLGSTKITDDGLSQLASLVQLEKLIVTRTAVTQAGVDELQLSLPDTEIQLQYVAPK